MKNFGYQKSSPAQFRCFWLFSERFIRFPRQYLFVGSERRSWVQFLDEKVVALLDNMVMIIEHAHAEFGLPGCNVDLHFEAEVPVRWDCWNIGGVIGYIYIYISMHIWNNFMAKKHGTLLLKPPNPRAVCEFPLVTSGWALFRHARLPQWLETYSLHHDCSDAVFCGKPRLLCSTLASPVL